MFKLTERGEGLSTLFDSDDGFAQRLCLLVLRSLSSLQMTTQRGTSAQKAAGIGIPSRHCRRIGEHLGCQGLAGSPVKRRAAMGTLNEQVYREKLAALNCSQNSVEGTSAWCLFHRCGLCSADGRLSGLQGALTAPRARSDSVGVRSLTSVVVCCQQWRWRESGRRQQRQRGTLLGDWLPAGTRACPVLWRAEDPS